MCIRDRYGNDDRDDGSIDKEFRHGQSPPPAGAAYTLGLTGIPSLAKSGACAANVCIFWMPSTTTLSPGFNPSVMIQFGPTRSPTFTGRTVALLSDPVSYT